MKGGSSSFIGVIMLVLVVVALELRRLWAWGTVWGRGASFVGVGRRLWAWGAIWGQGVLFVGVGRRLWTGGVVAEVVWWLASSC